MRNKSRVPKLALAGVFLTLAVMETARGMAEAPPGESFAFRLGYGMPFAIPGILGVAVLVLILSGTFYLLNYGRAGLTFSQAIFNWPVVLVAGIAALWWLSA